MCLDLHKGILNLPQTNNVYLHNSLETGFRSIAFGVEESNTFGTSETNIKTL